ncbi:CARDB domain-containing protein [Halorientalis halophila]|uniref:CARDB domain-containing protein n=1 Tax=Halorientalis halophila TaxID=3108499 RepID=UPI00300A47F8
MALAVGLGASGGASAETTGSTATNATVDGAQEEQLILTKSLRLTPNQPGEITVTARFDPPENLVELETGLPDRTTVIDTDGFSAAGDGYEWDGRTEDPSVTYRLSVNETREAQGPLSGRGDLVFVDAGPWAIVRTPQVSVSWSWRGGNVTLDRRTTVPGEGVASESISYLGPYSESTRLAHGQRFRLIVPEAAELRESPDRIFESTIDAADRLRVGDRDDSVFMFAAPTTGVGWSVQGLQTGDDAFWVRDTEMVDTADNVWVHEYVHTRQDYLTEAEARWFTEASASYYAALITLEQGLIDYDEFRDRLALGERRSERDTILSQPGTWTEMTPYLRGALVAGELDRRTRLATDGRTLQGVFRRVNAAGDPVTGPDLRQFASATGGSTVGDLTHRYTTTDARPSTWSEIEHQRAFEGAAPRFEYSLGPAADRYRVDGPYRNGSLEAGAPVQLATDERLSLTVLVENTGDASGTFDAALTVDGEAVSRRTGSLDPDEGRTLTFSHAFDETGTYTLAVGTESVTVGVSEPAAPTVADLRSNASRIDAGDRVGLTAAVGNDAPVPAAGTITLRRNDTVIDTRSVVVQPGADRTVAFADAPGVGVHRYTAGNASTTVTVEAPATEPGDGASATAADGAGFGVSVAVLATALLAVRALRSRPF